MKGLPRLYAVADAAFGDPVQLAAALADGGVRLIQLRHKEATSRTLLEEAEEIVKMLPGEVRVVINDRADVARLAGVSGVHLGQTDLVPHLARRILDRSQFIGYSTHNLGQALSPDTTDTDYIAVGPIFSTSTKPDSDPVLGLAGLREICSQVRKPVVAIGGITLQTARQVLDCGAASVAVISDLLKYGNVSARAREWVRYLEGEKVF